MRIDQDNYYLDIALEVSERATCLRRRFGAVLVKDHNIVSTGYNGAPRGCEDCLERGWCVRKTLEVPQGQRYELCRSVHAEMNALLHAGRDRAVGSTLYLAGRDAVTGDVVVAHPCIMCARQILNAGVVEVVIRTPEGLERHQVDPWRRTEAFWVDSAVTEAEAMLRQR